VLGPDLAEPGNGAWVEVRGPSRAPPERRTPAPAWLDGRPVPGQEDWMTFTIRLERLDGAPAPQLAAATNS
jgi:hypothetical protein